MAVVGIVLAVLLFPRPDTGGAVPGSGSDQHRPAELRRRSGARAGRGDPAPVEAAVDPERVVTGPKPGTEALMAARNRPEAIYAGKIITPLSAIRYT